EADLFVSASLWESFGMAADEALAHGLPVVCTTGGALPETVPAAAGRHVPPGDAVALAEAIAHLLTHPEEAAAAAAAARRHAETRYGWIDAARALLRHLDGGV
ncbi:MAG: glycosyltransferase, partial [Deltaproteobacteria bacterium]